MNLNNIMKKYILGLALVVALVLPGLASAQSITVDTQATITALLQQIAALQAQILALQSQINNTGNTGTDTTPVSAPWCHTFNASFGIGSTGDDVSALETVLTKEGISGFEHSSNFSASYSEAIASAVSGLQEKYNGEILNPVGLSRGTGYVGKSTRAYLNKIYGCVRPVSPLLPVLYVSLQVVSPNGGESMTAGSEQRINWYGYGRATDTYSIKLVSQYPWCEGASPCPMLDNASYAYRAPYTIATGIASASGVKNAYPWIAGKVVENAELQTGVYTIEICLDQAPTKCDSSDSFFKIYDAPIVEPGSIPVSIFYPDKGETFTLGQNAMIEWVGGAEPVVINLYSADTANYTKYTINPQASGHSTTWTVGKSLSGGTMSAGLYTLEICSIYRNDCDKAAMPIKIVNNGTGYHYGVELKANGVGGVTEFQNPSNDPVKLSWVITNTGEYGPFACEASGAADWSGTITPVSSYKMVGPYPSATTLMLTCKDNHSTYSTFMTIKPVVITNTPPLSIEVYTPNGGETLQTKSAYNIVWSGANGKWATISLLQQVQCFTTPCNDQRFTIATSVSSARNIYLWSAGQTKQGDGYTFLADAGPYRTEICYEGTNICDTSDSYFRIVTAPPPTQPITVDIKANGSNGPITIPYGTSATLTWGSISATSCVAAGNSWSGAKALSSSESTKALYAPATYKIVCFNSTSGLPSSSDSVTVNVTPAN